MKVRSPLTKSDNLELLYTLDTDLLVKKYKKAFNIDTSSYFKGTYKIQVLKCIDTGYKFYYPFNLAGDCFFYEQLQKYDWYYMPWKWEHQQTSKMIKKGMKVLEVGCAKGDFIKKISAEFGGKCVGLELNEDAAEKAISIGLNVKTQTIQDFSEEHKEQFDLVCSFQVLEHISDVYTFIESMLKCLKKGGRLVIGVPNNDSFLQLDDNILNQPPHHMGLWNKKSLSSLSKLFPIKIENLYFEPLQSSHLDYYKKTINDYKFLKMDRNISRFGLLGRFYNQFLKIFFQKSLKRKYPTIDNFTILAEYSKL